MGASKKGQPTAREVSFAVFQFGSVFSSSSLNKKDTRPDDQYQGPVEGIANVIENSGRDLGGPQGGGHLILEKWQL